jgi:hypothetical protein
VKAAAALAALTLTLLASSPPPLPAQALARGRVLRPGPSDTAPEAGVRVVLHRVGSDRQGPFDSVLSGPDGRFRFRYAPDTATIFLLSARFQGVEYFSQPLGGATATPDTGIAVLVHDTSSTAPIELAARHLIIPRAGEEGGREVIDFVILRNSGYLARVAPDTLGASWSMTLPPGSDGLEVGESDVSPEAVTRRGDTLLLAAPVGPGEKQLSLQYHLPGAMSVVTVPVSDSVGTFNVLVEDPGARVSGPGLAPADTQIVLGRTFRRWSGTIPAEALLRVQLPGVARGPAWLLALLVGGVALGLGAAAWRARRRTPAARPPPSPLVHRNELLERIAQLDAGYLGREAEVSPEEWRSYLDQRARLKAELEADLAVGVPPK